MRPATAVFWKQSGTGRDVRCGFDFTAHPMASSDNSAVSASMSPAEDLKRDLAFLLSSGVDSDLTVSVCSANESDDIHSSNSSGSASITNSSIVPFQTHSWILKLRSPFFRAMISESSAAMKEGSVSMTCTVDEIQPSVFKEVLI